VPCVARQDEWGLAYRGSMLQVQLYVNVYPLILNARLLDGIKSLREENPTITWTSPLASERFREYRDAAFLKALGLDGREHKESLFEFWPPGGPRWDALAQVKTSSGERGALLIEAKSHPGELRPTRGCCGDLSHLRRRHRGRPRRT
jgi:hypothetical protein